MKGTELVKPSLESSNKMPATSKKQQIAMRIALAAKKGKIPHSKLRGASKSMAEGMTKSQLEDFAKGPISKRPRMSAR
jgi:hypothetical protein